MEDQLHWELINPEGVVQSESRSANPHPLNLEGKTVLLRWNGKHNGDIFLDRIAGLLAEKIRDLKILKAWEVIPESGVASQSAEISQKMAARLAELRPDIVLASQSD